MNGLALLKVDVYNVAEDDIAGLYSLKINLAKDERFISANLLSRAQGTPLLRPYTIKSIFIPGLAKKFRIGILGLAARPIAPVAENLPYLWADPIAAAAKWIPLLRSQCDYLVVAACLPSRDAVQLAITYNDIDMILNGYKHQFQSPMAQINHTKILYAESEARTLGEARLLAKKGEPVQIFTIDHVLTSNIADDPQLAAFVATAKPEIAEVQNRLARSSTPSEAIPVAAPAAFLTTAGCRKCHEKAFSTWASSQHAHAMDTLKRTKKEFDTSCVGCHSTAAGKTGGFVDLYKTPQMANVQCESCHGTGLAHAQNPTAARMKTNGKTGCLTCHTRSNSPEFQFEAYWKKIAH
jgi:hypothetical protein